MPPNNPNRVPSYLTPPQFNFFATSMAGLLSVTTLIILCFIINIGSILLFEIEFGYQLKLLLEFGFLIACTSALWKQAFKV